jgi:hypothetical protein
MSMACNRSVWSTLGACAVMAALVASSGLAHALQQPSRKELGKELAQLCADDQADQKTPEADALTEAFLRRQMKRRDRCLEIMAAGGLASKEDFRNAALLLQHGSQRDDYLLGHILAGAAAFEGGVEFGEFLTAATLDRYLVHSKLPQCFGSQGLDPTAGEDPSNSVLRLNDAVRRAYGLEPLAPAQPEGKSKKQKVPSGKDVARCFKEMQQDAKDASPPSDERNERRRKRIECALQAVREGELAKPQELFQAASVLLESATAEELLTAHAVAGAAAIGGHREARKLSALSLDRWLVALDQPQRFGTAEGEAHEPREPWDKSLPDVVREAYGCAPLATSPGDDKRQKARR